jgi:hypothetical protein
MDTVTILRELWRRRILVGVVATAAILVALMLAYRPSLPPESRNYEVGIASSRILVDTPESQVLDVAPKGLETLGERANVLANLMVEGEIKAQIARRAGLSPEQLVGVGPYAAVSESAYSLTTRLVTNVTNTGAEALPIIEIEAEAPDAGAAARLAEAAVAALRANLDSKAAAEKVSDARRLQVTGLGRPEAGEATRGPRRLVALGAALFVFLSGCAAILVGSRLVRGWRGASGQDELGEVGDDVAIEEATVDRRTSPKNGSGSFDWPSKRRRPLLPRAPVPPAPADDGAPSGDGEARAESA